MIKFSAHKGTAHLTPWLIIGSAVILLLIVIILAVQNYNREKRYMSQILSEKGAALIRAVEAGTRTGMMGMMWGMEQVQLLLEETARMPGVLYMTVTDKNGKILAHNDRSKVGTLIQDFIPQMNSDVMQWHIVDSPGVQSRSFEVYREFNPVNRAELHMHKRMGQQMPRRGMMMGRQRAWRNGTSQLFEDLVIIAGLDVTPFENARAEDIRNTAIISAVLVLLGLGGFVSMFWAQSYRSAKRSLRDTSAFANEVVTHLPVGLIATDRNGQITFFNSAAESITGIRLSEARGKHPDDILPSEWCGIKSHLQTGQPVLEKEMECTFKNNRSVPLSVSATRIANEADEFVGNILILRDLGEIRRLQEQIRRQEKLAALGGLAAGVAHEIRNPLSSIKGIATFFKSQFGKESEEIKAANVMIQEVDRLNRVISELLDFARPAKLKLKPIRIHELLNQSIRLIQQDAVAKQIDIRLESDDDSTECLIDPDRFSQCLLNLYINAIQAMDTGGILSISSGTDQDNGLVLIAITDNGKGIPAADLSKIFDPYFTSKPTGTGLGLAIVHKIIEAHRGTINVNSDVGSGTRFTIALPMKLTDEALPTAAAAGGGKRKAEA